MVQSLSRSRGADLRPGAQRCLTCVPRLPTPWQSIEVRNAIWEPGRTVLPSDCEGLVEAADETAASEILLDDGPNRLLVGRLAQRRHWSATQARLLAQRIIWSHVDLLKGGADA